MPAVVRAAIEQQREAFRKKFGRDPSPDDPVFFDPDADTPRPRERDIMLSDLVKALLAANFSPDILYAFHQTGRIGIAAEKSGWAPEAIAEWNAAVDEFRAADPKDAELANVLCFPITDAHRWNFSHHNPAFTGKIEFDLELSLVGERVLRRARLNYEYTPEWEYFDLKKQALFTGWEGSSIGLELYTIPDPEDAPDDEEEENEDQEDDPDDPSPPAWVSIGDLAKIGALPCTVWERFYEMIEEKCRAEDIERRSARGL